MAIKVKAANLGESKEAVVSEIHVKVGDPIKKGSPLVSFESALHSMEVVSPVDGVVQDLAVSRGATVIEGAIVATLDESAPAPETSVSSVQVNERTQQLAMILEESVKSMTVSVAVEGGRKELKPLSFAIQGETLSIKEVCSPSGMMSLFALAASDIHSDVLQRREGAFPVIYYYDKGSLMEVVPYFPSAAEFATQGVDSNSSDVAFATVAHMLHFALEDYVARHSSADVLVNGETVPLDPLFQKWYDARQSYKVTVYHPTRPEPAPSASSGPMSV